MQIQIWKLTPNGWKHEQNLDYDKGKTDQSVHSHWPSGFSFKADGYLSICYVLGRVQRWETFSDALKPRLNDTAPEAREALLERIERIVTAYPQLVDWIVAASRYLDETVGIMDNFVLPNLAVVDKERLEKVLETAFEPRLSRNFLKNITIEELKVMIYLEHIRNPYAFSKEALYRLMREIMSMKKIRRDHNALAALWGAAAMRAQGWMMPDEFESLLNITDEESMGALKEFLNSYAFTAHGLKTDFDLAKEISKTQGVGVSNRFRAEMLLDAWVNHIFSRLDFNATEAALMKKSVLERGTAWNRRDFLTNLILHSTFLNEGGLKLLREFMLDLAQSPLDKSGEHFLYTKRYEKLKKDFAQYPEFLEAWQGDYEKEINDVEMHFDDSWKIHLDHLRTHIQDSAVYYDMDDPNIRSILLVGSRIAGEQLLDSNKASEVNRRMEQMPDYFMSVIGYLERQETPRIEEVQFLLKTWEDAKELIKVSLPKPFSAQVKQDLQNLLEELQKRQIAASVVGQKKLHNLRLSVTDDPATMLLMGEEPFKSCQGCTRETGQTTRGQLINRLRFGQFKLANIYEDNKVIARAVLEAGFNDQGKPALLVEKLYSNGPINKRVMAEMILDYAKQLKVFTAYFSDHTWSLVDLNGEYKTYKLIPGADVYRDTFHIKTDKEEKEPTVLAVEVIPQRPSPAQGLPLP